MRPWTVLPHDPIEKLEEKFEEAIAEIFVRKGL